MTRTCFLLKVFNVKFIFFFLSYVSLLALYIWVFSHISLNSLSLKQEKSSLNIFASCTLCSLSPKQWKSLVPSGVIKRWAGKSFFFFYFISSSWLWLFLHLCPSVFHINHLFICGMILSYSRYHLGFIC